MARPLVTLGLSPGKGRGCFAVRDIDAGEVIERAPALVFTPDLDAQLRKTLLDHYLFVWEPGLTHTALVLGYGSLYNHSFQPNAVYHRDYENKELIVTALKPIKAGEEVVFNYNRIPDCMDSVWFEVKP